MKYAVILILYVMTTELLVVTAPLFITAGGASELAL